MTANSSPSAAEAHGDETVPVAAETILVGVDGSASAARAARWAAEEAGRRAAVLTLVHALRLPTPTSAILGPMDYAEQRRAEGRNLLDEQASALRADHPGLSIGMELSDLDPAHTLARLGESATLLVTGNRGRGGFTGMLLGSVSRKLAVHTPCPLVVVRGERTDRTDKRVVLGVGRKHSQAAVRHAFEAARRHDASLQVVRAYYPSVEFTGVAAVLRIDEGHGESDQVEAEEEARGVIEPWIAEFPDVSVEFTAVEGNAVPVLIDAARDARLLVVARHRRHGPLPVGAGYVVDGVLAHSPTPVAVVPDR